MTVENISRSNSTKVLDQARIRLGSSGSTIRLTTNCPSGPRNICISCKHQGFRVVVKLSQLKVYRSCSKTHNVTIYVGETRSSYMLNILNKSENATLQLSIVCEKVLDKKFY